jgi:hypothetical protein
MAVNEKATIVDLVEGLPRLRVFDEEISTFEDKCFHSSIPIAEKNTYIGIEVEAENLQVWHQQASPYWRMTEDGSLRNNGREFVSIPIKAFRVENALRTLFDTQINQDIDFSDRTSIHIHMNVRTMTLEQLKTMILLYLVFEKTLFRYVHPDRYNSIFCVPLNETSFGDNLFHIFHSDILSVNWSKYTALNLCPIFEKGTIEFRQLHGTKNVAEIVNWVNLILCLKKAALKNPSEYLWDKVKTLNTSSQYHEFANEIFGNFITHLDEKTLINDMATCVTYVKSRCFPNTWRVSLTHSVSPESPLYQFSIYKKKPVYQAIEDEATRFFEDDVEEEDYPEPSMYIPTSTPVNPVSWDVPFTTTLSNVAGTTLSEDSLRNLLQDAPARNWPFIRTGEQLREMVTRGTTATPRPTATGVRVRNNQRGNF